MMPVGQPQLEPNANSDFIHTIHIVPESSKSLMNIDPNEA